MSEFSLLENKLNYFINELVGLLDGLYKNDYRGIKCLVKDINDLDYKDIVSLNSTYSRFSKKDELDIAKIVVSVISVGYQRHITDYYISKVRDILSRKELVSLKDLDRLNTNSSNIAKTYLLDLNYKCLLILWDRVYSNASNILREKGITNINVGKVLNDYLHNTFNSSPLKDELNRVSSNPCLTGSSELNFLAGRYSVFVKEIGDYSIYKNKEGVLVLIPQKGYLCRDVLSSILSDILDT